MAAKKPAKKPVKKTTKRKPNAAFMKELQPSRELAEVVGADEVRSDEARVTNEGGRRSACHVVRSVRATAGLYLPLTARSSVASTRRLPRHPRILVGACSLRG